MKKEQSGNIHKLNFFTVMNEKFQIKKIILYYMKTSSILNVYSSLRHYITFPTSFDIIKNKKN